MSFVEQTHPTILRHPGSSCLPFLLYGIAPRQVEGPVQELRLPRSSIDSDTTWTQSPRNPNIIILLHEEHNTAWMGSLQKMNSTKLDYTREEGSLATSILEANGAAKGTQA